MIKIVLVEPGENLHEVFSQCGSEDYVIALPGTYPVRKVIERSLQGLDERRSCRVGPYRVTITEDKP